MSMAIYHSDCTLPPGHYPCAGCCVAPDSQQRGSCPSRRCNVESRGFAESRREYIRVATFAPVTAVTTLTGPCPPCERHERAKSRRSRPTWRSRRSRRGRDHRIKVQEQNRGAIDLNAHSVPSRFSFCVIGAKRGGMIVTDLGLPRPIGAGFRRRFGLREILIFRVAGTTVGSPSANGPVARMGLCE
jgi:hypothetical protein